MQYIKSLKTHTQLTTLIHKFIIHVSFLDTYHSFADSSHSIVNGSATSVLQCELQGLRSKFEFLDDILYFNRFGMMTRTKMKAPNLIQHLNRGYHYLYGCKVTSHQNLLVHRLKILTRSIVIKG